MGNYTEPFYVGRQNPRFPTAHNGYLPALSTKETPIVNLEEEAPPTRKQWDIITQLRLDQINLRNTLYNTLKELKARSASKRETFTIKGGDGG